MNSLDNPQELATVLPFVGERWPRNQVMRFSEPLETFDFNGRLVQHMAEVSVKIGIGRMPFDIYRVSNPELDIVQDRMLAVTEYRASQALRAGKTFEEIRQIKNARLTVVPSPYQVVLTQHGALGIGAEARRAAPVAAYVRLDLEGQLNLQSTDQEIMVLGNWSNAFAHQAIPAADSGNTDVFNHDVPS